MPEFARWSIRTKLLLLAAASASASLLLAAAAFLVNDLSQLRRAKVHELEAQADVLGYNCEPLLGANDRHSAQQLLWALDSQLSVERVALFGPDGGLFAETCEPARGDSQTRAPDFEGHRFLGNDKIEVYRPFTREGKLIGGVYLRATLKDLRQQFLHHLWIAAGVLLGALGVATGISFSLQRRLTEPILTLAAAARRITTDENYSLRVSPRTADEIGALYLDFNSMLDQIERHKRALRDVHVDLERRVIERTQQLVDEIVQRERAQKELVRARDAAEAASRAKSEFLANMSHEMRTPLNAVLGFTDLLRMEAVDGPEQAREFLEMIHRSGKHLLGLINDILDLSKIEAGRMEVERVRYAPHELLAEVVSSLKIAAAEKALVLASTWSTPIPATLDGDPARLRQLLLNLVGNAIKFTDRGEVRIEASVDRAAREFAIAVIDTGIGIPEDKRDEIFESFCQGDSSVTRKYGGTGLGLSICRHIIRALGGRISLESEVGRGSTFTVVLPTGPLEDISFFNAPGARSGGAPGSTLPEHDGKAGQRKLEGMRVLVAEDCESNRRLIQLVLSRAGCAVTMRADGREAFDAAVSEPFDLIVMDMEMPVMDGYTAAAALRERGVVAPIVALTGAATAEDEARWLRAGCTDYLPKPVEPKRLLDALRSIAARGADSEYAKEPRPELDAAAAGA